MSSMRNAVQRRNHRERGQLEGREKWGILEKHKVHTSISLSCHYMLTEWMYRTTPSARKTTTRRKKRSSVYKKRSATATPMNSPSE